MSPSNLDGHHSHHRPRHRKRRNTAHPLLLFGPALALSTAFTVPALIGGGQSMAAGPAGRSAAPSTSQQAPADAPGQHPSPSTRRRTTHARVAIRRTRREARHPAWVRPDVGPITSYYGYRPSLGDFHPGLDLGGPYGSPIRAAAAGRIVFAGPASGFGQMIRIRHAGGIATVYGHMCRILVYHGRVRAGQVIALEGSEGRSTGPHLHFEVWVHGQRVNPLPFLRRHGVHI